MQKRASFFKKKTGIPAALAALVFIALTGLVLAACPTDTDDKDPVTYTVSFSPGEGGGTAPATQKVESGTIFTLPNQGGMTAPTGKTFAGWNAGGQGYAAGDSFTVTADTVFTARWNSGTTGSGTDGPYAGFYNYPTGRVDQSGLLKVTTSVAKETLLFNGTVDKANYLGTVSPLGNVQLKLPDEKFYTIVAVDKANYEERQAQAAQFNALTYYSNTQPYSVTVSPATAYGGGSWVFNNNTTFWVQIKKADLSENYAVIAPSAQRVIIPIAVNTLYDYFVYFSKELKYGGKVVALVETTDRSQANTAQATDTNPVYTTTISAVDVPTNNIKPAVMLKNNSNKTVRVYYGGQQKTNGAAGNDMAIIGGASLLVSGFETGDNTNAIEFNAMAWEQNKKVPVDQIMAANKVYEITIPNSENASEITVTEADSSKYYN
jgi:hypothetical protein